MNRSAAEILWDVASVLARDAAEVSRPPARALPALLFFTDPERTPRPWETAARLPPGSGVVFRHFGRSGRIETGQRLREATLGIGGRLLIGLDAEMAEAVGADGVHLPERSLDQAPALAASHPDWLLTGAVHSSAAFAAAAGLDAMVASPVFPAGGASSASPALGVEVFRELAEAAPCPLYALGGVHAGNAAELIGSGAVGLAGVSAIRAAFGSDGLSV